MPQDATPVSVLADRRPLDRPRVALLIDGDNISHEQAGRILVRSASHGETIIRRVYGHAAHCPGWLAAPGLHFCHAGSHKNAADLLMTVEAMDIMLGKAADILVIASSDSDFTHLATHLREKGHPVIGLGEAKAPESYRRSCSKFLELPAVAQTDPLTPEDQVVALLRKESGRLPIVMLSARMRSLHDVTIGGLGEKTWRAWLSARPDLFALDPKGPQAKVALKTKGA